MSDQKSKEKRRHLITAWRNSELRRWRESRVRQIVLGGSWSSGENYAVLLLLQPLLNSCVLLVKSLQAGTVGECQLNENFPSSEWPRWRPARRNPAVDRHSASQALKCHSLISPIVFRTKSYGKSYCVGQAHRKRDGGGMEDRKHWTGGSAYSTFGNKQEKI